MNDTATPSRASVRLLTFALAAGLAASLVAVSEAADDPRQIVGEAQRRSQAIGQAHGTRGPIGERSEIDQIDRRAGDHLEPAGLFLNPNPALGLDHQNGADDRTGDDRHDPERFQGAVERMTG